MYMSIISFRMGTGSYGEVKLGSIKKIRQEERRKKVQKPLGMKRLFVVSKSLAVADTSTLAMKYGEKYESHTPYSVNRQAQLGRPKNIGSLAQIFFRPDSCAILALTAHF